MIPVLTRLQARARHSLAGATFSRPSPLGWVSASSSELPQQFSSEEGVICSDIEFGGCPSTLREMRGLLQFPPAEQMIIPEKQFIPNATDRK